MEESKGVTSHPPAESHGMSMHGISKFLPDRQSPLTFPTGGFQSVSLGGPVSTINSVNSSMKQSHGGETQLASTPLKSSASPLEKNYVLSAQSHAGTPHLRFDGRFNGSSYSTQRQGTTLCCIYFSCIMARIRYCLCYFHVYLVHSTALPPCKCLIQFYIISFIHSSFF